MNKLKRSFLPLWLALCLLFAGCEAELTPFSPSDSSAVSLDNLPAFQSDVPWVEINGNVPNFPEKDLTEDAFELYADLDALGRCGAAYANVCQELMPTEARGNIGSVRPTGWQTAK